MSARVAITEGARSAPVGAAWVTIWGADPATQVSVVVGVLTCAYLGLQMWLIIRKLRRERRELQILEREHRDAKSRHEAQMDRLLGERDSGGGS
ncbi:MAG: hypothetical protein ACOC0M_00215 [Halomonas sp.]